jgi:N-acetylmuramoyl-L-alanine amidase
MRGENGMKKIIAVAIASSICALSSVGFAANNEPSIYLNGEKMTFDVNPFIENDRTLVPMRAIFEAVGADVDWDAEHQTVMAAREKNGEFTYVALQIDSNAFLNGEQKELDVPAKIVDDLTFVPLRFVVESLGEKVEWDNESYSVIITTEQ